LDVAALLDVTQCRMANRYRCFGGKYCLNLQSIILP